MKQKNLMVLLLILFSSAHLASAQTPYLPPSSMNLYFWRADTIPTLNIPIIPIHGPKSPTLPPKAYFNGQTYSIDFFYGSTSVLPYYIMDSEDQLLLSGFMTFTPNHSQQNIVLSSLPLGEYHIYIIVEGYIYEAILFIEEEQLEEEIGIN